MSIIELALVVIAAVPGIVILFVARRGGWLLAPVARPPFPKKAAIIAGAAMILGAAAGFAIGAASFELFLEWSLPEGTQIVIAQPAELLVVRLRLGAVPAVWLALPGGAALGWLARSRDRSPRAAALFGVVVALGFGVGAATGLALAPAALAALIGSFDGLSFGDVRLDDVVAMHTGLSFSLGVAGALLTGAAVAASRTPTAFKAALAVSGAMIALLLLVAGIATPPDLVSQLLLAVVLIGAWVAGLVLAGVMLAVRAR